ncbi:MAG: hypothetical protein Q4G68_07385 [Planctomycetia bacterium]|nr:hypothetical protein [Planctomycetia bacterium]
MTKLTKREFLQVMAGGCATLALGALWSNQQVRAAEDVIVLNDDSLSWVKGFNYQPSYATHGLDVWVDLNTNRIDYELKKAKELFPAMTAIRVWLSLDAYWQRREQMPKNVAKFLEIAASAGLKVLPCMTSAWHGTPDFGGVCPETFNLHPDESFFPYYDDVILSQKDNETVIGWDLCNEPFNNGGGDVFMRWLTAVRNHLKEKCPDLKLTIASANSLDQAKVLEPLCDFITDHPYFASPEKMNALTAFANEVKKPLLATEVCWGAHDDASRSAMVENDLTLFNARKVGFMIHALWHSNVADLHRPEYGPVAPGIGYMGCIELDGTIRPGHEVINKYL